MVYPTSVAKDDKNIQAWPTAVVTTFLRKFRTPAMIDFIISGSAAAALPAIQPRSLAGAVSLFLNHSLSFLGFSGGVDDPPAPPVSEVMIVEIFNPNAVKTTVIVIFCSLKMSLTFSRRVRFPSRIFLYHLPYLQKLRWQFFAILSGNF